VDSKLVGGYTAVGVEVVYKGSMKGTISWVEEEGSLTGTRNMEGSESISWD
jgi:hypothetical protein